MPNLSQTSAKLPQNPQPATGMLTVAQVAQRLGKSVDTIKRWCESGKLPAFPQTYGTRTTYAIAPASVEVYLHNLMTPSTSSRSKALEVTPHADYFDSWVLAMQRGLITGRPFSPLTIRDYETVVRSFLKSQAAVAVNSLERELLKIPAACYANRFRLYKGVVCFAKHLIRHGALDDSFLMEAKPLFPKRHTPPKRSSLDEAQLRQLFGAKYTPFQTMMLTVLVGTGLRASEAVSLRRSDIDFERHVLTVRKGKGNKARKLGLSPNVESVLLDYFSNAPGEWVFADETGRSLKRTDLYHRINKLGRRAGVDVSPHTLRRTFVTLNANKGQPLQMLQIACGHADIKTTRDYCLTTEDEVVEAMREW